MSNSEYPILKQWDHAQIVWKVRLDGFKYKEMPQLTHLARLLTSPQTLTRKNSLMHTGLEVMGADFWQIHPYIIHAPKIPSSKYGWIVKPANGFNGKGIHIFWDQQSLNKHLQQHICKNLMVQEYIDRPLLLNQRKFDLRMYVLLTPQKILIHKRGYVRMAHQKFTTGTNNKGIHLTNSAVHRGEPAIEHLSVLKQFGITSEKIYTFMRQLKPLFEYAQQKEQAMRAQEKVSFYTFELLGVDIIYDHKYKPWLLEINADPGIKTVGPYRDIAPHVINDTLKETIFGGETEFFVM